MKMLKKLTSFLVVAMLILGMATTAFAAGTTYTITINNTTAGHTYEAYQIFAGDLAADGTLSNITWGTGVNTAATGFPYASPQTAASVAEDLSDGTITAAAFATAIAPYLSTTKASSTYNTTNYTIANLDPGYYLVKDQDGTLTGNDSYTNYILEVVKNVTVTPKADVPTVEKKVKDTNDTTGVTTGWEDSADYDIGDTVPFQLTGTLPDNYASYTTYKYEFHDTLSAGLTYNNDVKVYVDNAGTEPEEITSSFTVTSSGTALTVSCANLKAITGVTIDANSEIIVRYSATLNANAVIGTAGNPNECYLVFSNNPNGTGDGQTPDDEVKVYTYKVVINKVDGDGAALNGAAFKLEKKVPAEVTQEHPDNFDWVMVGNIVGPDAAINVFEFKGLDEGDYKLTETTTPAGYNTIDPIEFTINADHSGTLAVTSSNDALTLVSTGDNANGGTLTTNVENQKGSTLPSTGGIGTTIFYVVGSLLVVGAVIVLITRKKMKAVK